MAWDIKQLGIGSGGTAALLFLLQSQGVGLISEKENAENRVVLTQVQQNSAQITELKATVTAIQSKFDDRLQRTEDKITGEISKITEILRVMTADRFTKTEHASYSQMLESRLRRIEDELAELRLKERK